MKIKITPVLFILLALTLIGCSSSLSTPTINSSTQPSSNSQTNVPPENTPQANPAPDVSGTGYPAPDSGGTAYPAQDTAQNLPTSLPAKLAPESDKVGLIKGKLDFDLSRGNGTYPLLYLAEIKTDSKGNAMVASLDRTTAPRAIIDRSGNFAFLNVTPGKYVLMIDRVLSLMIMNDDNGKEKVLEIQGGKTVDVGTVSIP